MTVLENIRLFVECSCMGGLYQFNLASKYAENVVQLSTREWTWIKKRHLISLFELIEASKRAFLHNILGEGKVYTRSLILAY